MGVNALRRRELGLPVHPLREHGDIKAATTKLIEAANENGGADNITALLVRWAQ